MDTQRQNRFAWIAVGALATSTLGMIAMTQLGPLEPPVGGVADTSPDLAELQSQLEAVSDRLDEPEVFEVFNAPLAGSLNDQLFATLVAPGRVFVESITTYHAHATVFDGPGQVDTGFRTLAGDVVGRSTSVF
ncbi:MAG: hypothetical protein AAGI17_10845, partial [Planctomycetota bacterium]